MTLIPMVKELGNAASSMNMEIPAGLADMLRDFTVSVLRERPQDLFDYAVDYFTEVRDSKKAKQVPMYVIVDSDEDDGEPEVQVLSTRNRYDRRRSVAAERYNPESDSDDEMPTVHPKSDEQRLRLADSIRDILIFRALDSEQLQNVIDAMFEYHVKPGDCVIEQGDDGDNFYVIEQGLYDVFVVKEGAQRKVHEFQHKGSFGELALMYNMPRSATVEATTEGTLWAMDRKSFRSIVLKSAFLKRKMYEEFLENVPMLEMLENYERMNLADALSPKSFAAGDCIIREGDEADGMYFIESGEVRVTLDSNNETNEKEVGSLGKGKYFGEMALVENKPRSANVYALDDVKLAFLEKESFERLLGPCLDIMKRNMEAYESL